jgi:hypothetical protein
MTAGAGQLIGCVPGTHAPAPQYVPPGQTTPQAPQFPGSPAVSVQYRLPLAASTHVACGQAGGAAHTPP